MIEDTQTQSVWWGTFSLEEEQAGCWRVGPRTVWIYRTRQEWRIVHQEGNDPFDGTARVTLPLAPEEASLSLDDLDPAAEVSRFSFRQTDERVTVTPALADRAIVVRPEKPLYVLAGQQVTLYVSTPVWLSIDVGEPAHLLQEIPSYRPSDTWFGPSTIEGELCYASRSTGRLKVEDLPPRLHRAITPLVIHNQAEEALLLERIRLPVQHLSLFQAANHLLWTETLTMERQKHGDEAALHLSKGPPPEAQRASLIQEPRIASKTNLIVRTFSTFFHLIKEA